MTDRRGRAVRRRCVIDDPMPAGTGIMVAVAISAALWIVLILCGFLAYAVF